MWGAIEKESVRKGSGRGVHRRCVTTQQGCLLGAACRRRASVAVQAVPEEQQCGRGVPASLPRPIHMV